MKVKYKLTRKEGFVEDFRNDQRLTEAIKKQLQARKRGKLIELDLGTEAIPIEDFIFNRLTI